MRLNLVWLVVATCIVCGCIGSDAPTPLPQTANGGGVSHTDQAVTLRQPTGRVAELVSLLQETDRQVAFDAATALGNMGPDAIDAMPALVELATFDDKGSHRVHPTLAAAEALPKISAEAAVPYLIVSLKDRATRYHAARILGELGCTAKPAVSALVDSLRETTSAQTEDERNASAQAAVALAKITPHGLSALISEMGHDDPEVRKLAVWATPKGADGKPAVSVLAQRLSDSDSDIRRLAAVALADIGPDAADSLPYIKMALEKERNGFVAFSLRRAHESITKRGSDKQ